MKITLMFIALVLAAGLYATTALAYEEPEFEVLETTDDFELRRYQPMLVAETTVQGDFDEAGSQAFRILAGYIFGKNEPQEKMAMTAPVISNPKSSEYSANQGEKMAMTAPVLSAPQPAPAGEKMAMTAPVVSLGEAEVDKSGSPAYVYRFVMEKKYSKDTLPLPLDERVTIREIPGRLVAAHRFSGTWSERRVLAHQQALLDAIERSGLTPIGPPELARYDAPFKPWFLRRNEILIQVQEAGS